MAGLVCDGDFNTASMNLHKFNDVYFPNDDFYNCNIFPEEWIEIFMSEVDQRHRGRKVRAGGLRHPREEGAALHAGLHGRRAQEDARTEPTQHQIF